MQGTIKILGKSGHEEVTYDTEVPESVEVAKERLKEEKRDKSAAFFDGESGDRIGGSGIPDPEDHEQIVVLPPMAGG